MSGLAAVVSTRHEFDYLLGLYLPIGCAVFAIVAVLLTISIIAFRKREGRQASRRSEAPLAELVYVLGLAAVVVVLVAATFVVESKVDAVAKNPALRIKAIAGNWHWRFDYPAQTISIIGSTQRPAELVVPANQTVHFDLTSLDVVHAFWIPSERFQREAFPRFTNSFDLSFNHPGRSISGACNEFCGLGHTQMRFVLHVVTSAQFATWAKQHQRVGGAA